MESTLITEFYRSQKPQKRRELLEQAIQSGQEPEKNAIRKEILDLRYETKKTWGSTDEVDTFMRLWMALEFNKEAVKSFMGQKSGRREILKNLDAISFLKIMKKSELHKELLYQECVHLVKLYISLCEKDKSYRNALMGLITMSDEKVEEKIRGDIYQTAVRLPVLLELTDELGLLTRAARAAYAEYYPDQDPLPEN